MLEGHCPPQSELGWQVPLLPPPPLPAPLGEAGHSQVLVKGVLTTRRQRRRERDAEGVERSGELGGSVPLTAPMSWSSPAGSWAELWPKTNLLHCVDVKKPMVATIFLPILRSVLPLTLQNTTQNCQVRRLYYDIGLG